MGSPGALASSASLREEEDKVLVQVQAMGLNQAEVGR